MDDRDKKIAEVVQAWNSASMLLGIRVIAPFDFGVGTSSHKCVAYLPDFGGSKGMFIQTAFPPDFAIDQGLANDAKKEGYFVSFINPDQYCRFDSREFQEALNDWGYYGPTNSRPQWMDSSKNG